MRGPSSGAHRSTGRDTSSSRDAAAASRAAANLAAFDAARLVAAPIIATSGDCASRNPRSGANDSSRSHARDGHRSP